MKKSVKKSLFKTDYRKTNCDKCFWLQDYSKCTLACCIEGFQDKGGSFQDKDGSSCNIIAGTVYRFKDGQPVVKYAYLDKTNPEVIKLIKKVAKDIGPKAKNSREQHILDYFNREKKDVTDVKEKRVSSKKV